LSVLQWTADVVTDEVRGGMRGFGMRIFGILSMRGRVDAHRRRGLVGGAVVAITLASGPWSQAGLLTNFSASYAQYEGCCMSTADYDSDGNVDGRDFLAWQRGRGLSGQTSNALGDADGDTFVLNADLGIWRSRFGTTGGLPSSTCFKLYFDPQGITAGQVTLFIDAPLTTPEDVRFGSAGENGLFLTDPRYNVRVLQSTYSTVGSRQRIEVKVGFNAIDPLNPPSEPVTILGYQVRDLQPVAVPTAVAAGFNFDPGDFITIFDTATAASTTFNHTQLADVPLNFEGGFLSEEDVVLAIDVDPPSSASSYAIGEGPLSAFDQFVNTKYVNSAKRNAGFIAGSLSPAPTIVRSMGLRSALDTPLASDPVSYALYGTNSTVFSPDNSDGSFEDWTLIATGPVDMPITRGNATGVTFDNSTPYRSYRVVFPEIRDFRAADSTQIADISLYESEIFSPPNVLDFFADPRAIQLPTPQAESPPGAGPGNILDGDGRTKYQMLGKENSGVIFTPHIGATQLASFVITTAGDTPERDPSSYIIYGTNDPILSQNFSQGTSESWIMLASGSLALPDERLALGPRIAVNSPVSYTSYRLVFPTMKNGSSPAATSMQFADIQFYNFLGLPPSHAAPEPVTLGLIGWCAAAAAWRRAARGRDRR